tara:strand:- start:283 stop:690 length:408 start_codon:yes stop_codon:yes gene_type:complete
MLQFERPQRKRKDINIIPLINVIFLMLIFFMVAGEVRSTDTLVVEAPKRNEATQEDVLYDDMIIVYVRRDGIIAVNHDIVDLKDFETIMKTSLYNYPDIPVRIKADKDLPAKKLLWMMRVIEQSGASQLSLFTEV